MQLSELLKPALHQTEKNGCKVGADVVEPKIKFVLATSRLKVHRLA